MAEFEMKCPHCGTQLTVQDDWAGMDAECPACKKTFKIDLGSGPEPKKADASEENNSSPATESSQSSESAENSSKKGNDTPDLPSVIIFLAVIALVGWLLWLFVTGMPRLAFWLIASLFWIIYAVAGGIKMKWLTVILLAGSLTWGWWAHNGTSSSDNRKTTVASQTEPGDAQAQFELGFRYATGEGVAQDWTEAVKWYRKAAEQGHAGAQFLLGVCYVNGKGVAEDMTEAIKWIRKAARQGNDKAQETLKKAGMDW